ncbi:DMT family transporter [Pseudotamlana carrageenivorans]|uniref:EamA family transporter n=1 Tax=Pseudotamlana carrageenivorans TaxID=2069432 RepID=A0A2I7SLP0_9FLAO|nr:DMT family transporter [Tamlana carrageenivorans]AUS06754.1 EamA family transporter [Tamlana carrageenivorans]
MDVRNAIKYMLISTLAFTCMNAIVKYLTHYDAFQIVFFRSLSSLFFTFGFLWKHKIPIFGNKRKLLVLRGIVGVTSMALFFMSTKYLPIGTAVSLRYMAPIFAAVFAVLLLKEKVKAIQWLFFLGAFIGVVILKGFDATLDPYGLLLIFISALFSGLVYVVISKIGKADHPVVVVNYFMVISTIIGGTVALFNWTNPVGIEWLMLFALGVFGYFGQVYMTKAFQIAATNQVAPLKYLEVIFTVMFGAFIFGEVYTIWSLLGITMIIVALALNALYKSKK